VSSIVIKPAAISNVVRMGVVNEVLNFFSILFFIFSFILVVNLGLDIEEGRPTVLATFAPMALCPRS
jgi:hypothetical protein